MIYYSSFTLLLKLIAWLYLLAQLAFIFFKQDFIELTFNASQWEIRDLCSSRMNLWYGWKRVCRKEGMSYALLRLVYFYLAKNPFAVRISKWLRWCWKKLPTRLFIFPLPTSLTRHFTLRKKDCEVYDSHRILLTAGFFFLLQLRTALKKRTLVIFFDQLTPSEYRLLRLLEKI